MKKNQLFKCGIVLVASALFIPKAQAQSTGVLYNTISGTVWNDQNDNQVMDPVNPAITLFPFNQENPIAGVVVKLTNLAGDSTFSATVSRNDGTYTLENYYGQGQYMIEFLFPTPAFQYPNGGTTTSYPVSVTSTSNLVQNIGIVRQSGYIYFGQTIDKKQVDWDSTLQMNQFPYHTLGLTNPSYQMVGNPKVFVSEAAHNPTIDLTNIALSTGTYNVKLGGLINNPAPGIPGSIEGAFELNSSFDINNLVLTSNQSISFKDFFSAKTGSRDITTPAGKALYDGSGMPGTKIGIPLHTSGISTVIGNGNLSATLTTFVAAGVIVVYKIQNETIVVLPVTFSSFSAKANTLENNSELNWTTVSERSNTGFEVERSNDGIIFNSLGFVDTKAKNGSNNGILNYSFSDKTPQGGANFYRLKQIDIDGTAAYSDVKKVEFSRLSNVSVYPNPTSTVLYVNCPENSKLSIIDLMGKVVLELKASDAGIQTLDVSSIASGNYLIQVVNGSELVSKKLCIK